MGALEAWGRFVLGGGVGEMATPIPPEQVPGGSRGEQLTL